MLKTLRFSYRLKAEMYLNSLVYFLKRVPLVKKLFRKMGYEHPKLGGILTVIGILYQILKKAMGVGICAFIAVGVPLLIREETVEINQLAPYFLHMYLFVYLLAGPIVNLKLLEANRTRFICIKVFRINAKQFVLSEYITGQILEVVLEALTFSIFAGILGVSRLGVFFLVLMKALFKCFFEWLDLVWYQKKSAFLHQKTWRLIGIGTCLLGACYIPVWLKKQLPLTMPVMEIIAAFLGVIGLISMGMTWRYPLYKEAALDSNLLERLSTDVQQVKAQAAFQAVKLDEKSYTKEELNGSLYEDKKGYDYLNALFFRRHRRQLARPVKIQTAIITILGLAAIGALIAFPGLQEGYEAMIKRYYLSFVFIMYVLSTAPKATKALFYNCDISLLRYGFYKEKRAVLSTFTSRLQSIMVANLIPAAVLAVMLIVTGVISGMTLWESVPVGILVIVLSIFFSVHNLFLYYILQPYTTELDVKNPLFNIVNTITYFISYLTLQVEGPPRAALFVILFLTIFYIGAALILVYRIAPKTFRVK
ncbi:MAG: hypothetical protein E7256_06445 [Lachnospiraceae bacterium]|nr:hypothetical protein [Lachnospiraceae bacterium]